MAIPVSRTRAVLSSRYWSSYIEKLLLSSAVRRFSSNAVHAQLEVKQKRNPPLRPLSLVPSQSALKPNNELDHNLFTQLVCFPIVISASFCSIVLRLVLDSTQTREKKVGFIGLGNMGFHMANNLINAGYKLIVNDIDQSAMKKFSDCGISTVKTAFEVAESSDVIITMLPSSSHVLDVYTGQNGLLYGGSQLRPWLFIDSSTIDPLTARNLSMNIAQRCLKEKKGNADSPFMLDAPVSGGVPGAAAGTLTFMVGGLEDAYLAAKPLFLAMGKNTIYCGGPGNGAAAKICNNLAMAVSMLGVSEAIALGQRLGIAANTLTNIFNSSSARCWSSDSYNPVPGVMEGVPSARSYNGGFSSKLMAKDLMLAKASAEEIQQKCPLTSEALNIYLEMCNKGYESKDFSCVFKHYYSGMENL